jgi:uncharacterized protein (DUF1330 family)
LIEINDMEAMQPYLEKVAATIAAHGGKYLVAGGEPEVIEGGLGQYPIKVLVEFASAAGTTPTSTRPSFRTGGRTPTAHLHVEGRFALSAA